MLKDFDLNRNDLLVWKKGAWRDAGIEQFGDPTASTAYTLCLWDSPPSDVPRLVSRADVPAGGTCSGVPCWRAISGGFKYSDKARSADGIKRITLKAAAAGYLQMTIKGKGDDLADPPPMPFTLPVTLEVQTSDGACFAAILQDAPVNEPGVFLGYK